MRRSAQIVGVAIAVLLCVAGIVWGALLRNSSHFLTVSFLNVGQGDAIFIETPHGRQVLIDGGPNSGVLRQLSSVMPWYDRSIDVVIPTHPDADHIGGLIDVLERYTVGMIVQSSVQGTTPLSDALERIIVDKKKQGTQRIEAQRGQIIDLGDGAYIEVFFPDRSVPNIETNTGCVVTKLIYGDTSFMLPCDAPAAIEKYLVSLDGKSLQADVLKAGHHGSKTSSSIAFVGFVDPEYAVYSRGCKNSYGHPHENTIATFKDFGVTTLDTCTHGTITFVSDGQKVNLK